MLLGMWLGWGKVQFRERVGHFRKGGACWNGMSRILGKTGGVLGKKLADLIRGVACREKVWFVVRRCLKLSEGSHTRLEIFGGQFNGIYNC